ncbi:MAG: 3'-5' exonuclease [Victivallaceae bacterium]|nr:3'-5' exonuclease [Victivallaceae bacterium]
MLNDLKLERPLVVFDIESTGVLPTRDRIIEIAVLKIMPDGTSQSTVRRLNPEMPIPAGSTAIHGITDADVADCPTFMIIAEKLYRYIDGCDLAGYNITGFDIPILQTEFKRAGFDFSVEGRKVVDAYNIFCKLYPRTLTAAYKFFCGKELEGAHGAMADTVATFDVLLGQLEKHPELPRELGKLAEFSDLTGPDMVDHTRRFKWSGDEVIVNFGKNSGRTLRDVAENDPGFLRWILRSDFTDEVKTIADNALLGKFPERKVQTDDKAGA